MAWCRCCTLPPRRADHMALHSTRVRFTRMCVLSGAAIVALALPSLSAAAQYGRDDTFTRLQPGMSITVRTDQPIDTRRLDYRVFYGVVDNDVRGDDGRLAIPRGSRAEMIVRRGRDNSLVLDLE